MPAIEVQQLVKVFWVVKKQPGLRNALRSLFRPTRTQKTAVDDVSFTIEQGEIVGYLGPNGAGKSTTIKMLTGVLHPTAGQIRVNGLSPQTQRIATVKQIGVVFGQRTQLYWDLPLGESFELMRRIYRIDPALHRANLRLMSDVLDIHKLIDIPVRQLSLGQRMRGDLVAAMLHSPSILFLDEPTIGLDVEAKYAMRAFIQEINRVKGTTVILTTHDLDDVEQLCQRIIVIDGGKIIEDGPLATLVQRMAPYRMLMVDFQAVPAGITHQRARLVKQEGPRFWFEFDRAQISASELIDDLSRLCPIRDLSIKEPDIEDVVRRIYRRQ